MTVSLETYIQDMARDGTYADHVAVDHTARMLEIPIRVIEVDYDHVFGSGTTDKLMLTIGYLKAIKHFVSIGYVYTMYLH